MADFARIRPLFSASSMDVAATLDAILEHLGDAGIGGNIRFTLLSDAEPQAWDLDLRAKKYAPVDRPGNRKAAQGVDLELVMKASTWNEIATGRLAPLDAFGAGRLRLRGDANLANELYERLKDDAGGATSVCR
ncbi:MAG: SCP2 sterol-binding domain-containing protein [Dehalococcoidia bacterium]